MYTIDITAKNIAIGSLPAASSPVLTLVFLGGLFELPGAGFGACVVV